MTKEKAKELLPIIQAFADGRTLQWKENESLHPNWINVTGNNCNFDVSLYEWRIKPEPREFWLCVWIDDSVSTYFSEEEANSHSNKKLKEIIHVKEQLKD